MRSVELFGGAGGLALGSELAGFHPEVFVEWDRWACDTVRKNKTQGHPLVKDWRIHEGDVRVFDWSSIVGDIDLVTAGPPCQPFSAGGKARAADDARDMFPAAAEVMRMLRPKSFLIENVKGLTRSRFASYYQLILLRLQYPEIVAREGETWFDHLHRLQKESASRPRAGLRYHVVSTVVDSADYGVPQRRHRVFIVGFRSDLKVNFRFPITTHSREALLHSMWITGEYWERHRVPLRNRPEKPSSASIRALSHQHPSSTPWRTVRDAFEGLPAPSAAESDKFLNHFQQPGARSYLGHTGSPIDSPAKTLKAGDHGVPGGENMLRDADGSIRYFSIRESARLQTFPDDYELLGSWSEAMRQLGNAVPVRLAQQIADSVKSHLAAVDMRAATSCAVRQARSVA